MVWGYLSHPARSDERCRCTSGSVDSLASATNLILSMIGEELMLQNTEEFQTFLTSVNQLKCAHEQMKIERKSAAARSYSFVEERCISHSERNDTVDIVHPTMIEEGASDDHQLSFFQRTASPELLVHIADFLPSADLSRLGSTCSRMYSLCQSHADQRCLWNIRQRQLKNTFQLLRCAEQMSEDIIHDGAPHVPFPLLLPKRRIIVSNCGDSDYNGVYYCTDVNGNGFVFSKPLSPRQRLPEGLLIEKNVGDTSPPGQQLRCTISKQFSETVRFD